MLEISDMVCGYGGVTALRGISLQVKAGQLVALIGANGAGKSTTLRAISGLVAPRSGSMLFEGKDIAGAKPPRVVASGIATFGATSQIAAFTAATTASGGPAVRSTRSAPADDSCARDM